MCSHLDFQDVRGHRRDRHREDSDEEHERRPVKKERHNPDYDKYAQAATSSRWEEEDDRPMRYQQRERNRNDERRREKNRGRPSGNPFRSKDGERHRWGKPGTSQVKTEEPPKEKEKPNFELSGKLTEETNTYRGVVIKYSEPPEARKPKKRWRFYPFKGDETLPVLHLHRQSAFLLGRDRKVADIPVDHPSCSKQHAALQFRLVPYNRPDGTKGRRVRPYIIDLGSSNGTYVNNQRIDSERYVELMEKDVVKFGFSTREYVLLHGETDTSELNEDEEDFGED